MATIYSQLDWQAFPFNASTLVGGPVLGAEDQIKAFDSLVPFYYAITTESDDTAGLYQQRLLPTEIPAAKTQLDVTYERPVGWNAPLPEIIPLVDPATLIAGTQYCQVQDLYRRFGSENVNKWSDLNNIRNADEIALTIITAIVDVSAMIDDVFRIGRYVVPFSPVPTMIKEVATLKAGYQLFSNRGIDDKDLSMEKVFQKSETMIRSIVGGQVQLDAPGTDRIEVTQNGIT